MCNQQGIHKSSLGQEESDMKDSEFDSEALAVLRRLVKKMS